jgi:hypothetical protein
MLASGRKLCFHLPNAAFLAVIGMRWQTVGQRGQKWSDSILVPCALPQSNEQARKGEIKEIYKRKAASEASGRTELGLPE